MNNEESVKVKEQAILELGGLLAQSKQAEGTVTSLFSYYLCLYVHFKCFYASPQRRDIFQIVLQMSVGW